METAPIFVHCCHCRCKIYNDVKADRLRLTDIVNVKGVNESPALHLLSTHFSSSIASVT